MNLFPAKEETSTLSGKGQPPTGTESWGRAGDAFVTLNEQAQLTVDTTGIAIYSMVDFANKVQSARSNNQNVSFDEWIGFTSSLHSFGMAAAGFTSTMLRTTDAILDAQEFLQVSVDQLTNTRSVRSFQ